MMMTGKPSTAASTKARPPGAAKGKAKNSGRAGVATEKALEAKMLRRLMIGMKVCCYRKRKHINIMTIQDPSDSKAAQYDTSDTIAAGWLRYPACSLAGLA